jgi:hypothetical protein
LRKTEDDTFDDGAEWALGRWRAALQPVGTAHPTADLRQAAEALLSRIESWDDHERPEPETSDLRAALQPVGVEQRGDCDWGDCDEDSVGVRNDKDGHGWLPVCQRHYDEAPDAERALHGHWQPAAPPEQRAEVRFFDHALTEDEVREHYAAAQRTEDGT